MHVTELLCTTPRVIVQGWRHWWRRDSWNDQVNKTGKCFNLPFCSLFVECCFNLWLFCARPSKHSCSQATNFKETFVFCDFPPLTRWSVFTKIFLCFFPEQWLNFISEKSLRHTVLSVAVEPLMTPTWLTHFSIRHGWVWGVSWSLSAKWKHCLTLSSYDIIIVITWDAFNVISPDGIHFEAGGEFRMQEAVKSTTSSMLELQGLFMAAFHQLSHCHDLSSMISTCNRGKAQRYQGDWN